jgi:predicted GIY-YIG superfamily endonuclease
VISIPATVYLIHFARPYKHAKHYVGYTALESVDDRMARHRDGRGSRLLQVVTQAGIEWAIVRLWQYDTIKEARTKERQLKNHSAGRNCPICCGGKK